MALTVPVLYLLGVPWVEVVVLKYHITQRAWFPTLIAPRDWLQQQTDGGPFDGWLESYYNRCMVTAGVEL